MFKSRPNHIIYIALQVDFSELTDTLCDLQNLARKEDTRTES